MGAKNFSLPSISFSKFRLETPCLTTLLGITISTGVQPGGLNISWGVSGCQEERRSSWLQIKLQWCLWGAPINRQDTVLWYHSFFYCC